jgi:hypothetical protein
MGEPQNKQRTAGRSIAQALADVAWSVLRRFLLDAPTVSACHDPRRSTAPY